MQITYKFIAMESCPSKIKRDIPFVGMIAHHRVKINCDIVEMDTGGHHIPLSNLTDQPMNVIGKMIIINKPIKEAYIVVTPIGMTWLNEREVEFLIEDGS